MSTTQSSLTQFSDAELVCQVQAGSAASFGVLAGRYKGRLLRYLAARWLSHHDAEDVVQETFARAFEHIRACDPARPFAAWLFTIAVRLAVSHCRTGRREVAAEGLDRADVRARDPGRAVADASQRDNLWAMAQQALPAAQYEALRLRYAREMPVKQIAREMRITTIHVKVLLHRARKRLLASRAFARSCEGMAGARATGPERGVS